MLAKKHNHPTQGVAKDEMAQDGYCNDAYCALPMEARDKDTANVFFFKAMLRGRDLLLQDGAMLMEELPSCVFLSHPIFSHSMWKEFRHRMLRVQANDGSLVKLEQANDTMALKMAVHGIAHTIMGKLDRLSKPAAPNNSRLDKLCQPKECASNASKWQ